MQNALGSGELDTDLIQTIIAPYRIPIAAVLLGDKFGID
jgi:hypothetical protein